MIIDNTDALTKTMADVHYVNQSGDTMNGDLEMNNNKLINLPNQTNEKDAVNKKYVDKHTKHFTVGENTLQMKKSIDMNSKKIVELVSPTTATDAANKDYADLRTQIIPFRVRLRNVTSSTKTVLLRNITIPVIQKEDQYVLQQHSTVVDSWLVWSLRKLFQDLPEEHTNWT
jgi:hypothetical protein